jgi:alkylation response protein AidB-like acyl-CoA dehydrogenase
MNFDFTNDQKMLQDQVRKFAQTELAPLAPEIDKSGEFPWPSL